MTFTPRRRKNYTIWKNGRAYYRRTIPERFRHLFGGKTAWVIQLSGSGRAELEAEAQALAHKHNRQMRFAVPIEIDDLAVPADTVAFKMDLKPDDLPPDAPPPNPMRFMRDGKVVEVFRFAVADDPIARRQAEAEGFFTMSSVEAAAQIDFDAQHSAYEKASTMEQKEIADLKSERAARQIADAANVSSETVLSILPRWRLRQKQAAGTWRKHVQFTNEFVELHGDLPLSEVTKKHVVAYSEHTQRLTYRGAPMSPVSVAKRLDTIRALMAFAVSVDVIDNSPAAGVKAPKDTRPKTARSWKSFEPEEVVKLERVAAGLWGARGNARAADLKVALHALIWTGARPEEICQLRRGDVDLVRGCILITNDESGDDARPRMMKNEHSIRAVPIHSRLTATLADHLHSHNRVLAFPTFEPHASRGEIESAAQTGQAVEINGRYARPIMRAWTETLRPLITDGDPRKVLYSLRHSWAAESRRSGMPEHVRNAIMGHANDNPHAGRYGGDADWLAEKRLHLERMNCLQAEGG